MAGPVRVEDSFRPSYRPQPRAQAGGIDPELKRMGMLAAGVGGVLALLVGGGLLLRGGHRGVPVIEAEAGPVRIKPANPGGMQVTGAELGGGPAAGEPKLAPAAEQPELNALKAQLREVKRALARQAEANAQAVKLAEAKAEAAKRAAEKAAAVKLAQAGAQPLPGGATPRVAAAPPVQRATATATIAPPPAPLPPPRPLPSHTGTAVQLAAFADLAAAQAGWETLVKQAPDLLAHRDPEITEATVAGRTVYRLRTAGFPDVTAATSFCARLKAKGAGCSVAAF